MSILTLERRGPVALLTINRPEALNALGALGDGDTFAAVCEEVNSDRSIKCAVLTGAGRAFSAGGDIKAMKARTGAFEGTPMQLRDQYRRNIHRIVKAVYGLEVPTIAAVNGAAIGLGCDVACMADIRLASAKAVFAVTFLKIGLIPGDGGAWLLPRTIGMSRASELLFTGKTINAAKAEEWGLVSQVCEPDALLDTALAMAAEIAAMPADGLRLAKSLMRHGQTSSYETLMDMSASAQAICHTTDDHEEGVTAIIEGRPPQFS
jgi:enoyl-CoA hydratase/carnithine racemase